VTRPITVVSHDPRIVQRPAGETGPGALSAWSIQGDAVLLHSDPAGVEPLSWRVIAGTLHLARYPALLARLAPACSLNLDTLQGLARIQYPGGTGSCFESVERVPAGCEISLDFAGRAGPPRPWYTFPREPDSAGRVDLWRALVDQCAALMRARGAGAVFLSGGLDSSAIAAAATAAAREGGFPPPVLLSVTYPGLPCDEARFQRLVADHLQLRLIQVDATRLQLWPRAQDSIQSGGIPTADFQAAATARLLGHAREEGRPLVLMGLGGDALFAGDGAELELYRTGKLLAAARFFRDWGEAGGIPGRVLWYRRGFRRHLRGRPFGSPAEVREAGSANRAGLRRALAHPAHGWRTEMIESTVTPPSTLGCPFYGLGFLAAFSRVRALDLAAGPGFKGLLRTTVAPHLPADVIAPRRKANFDDFHRTWIARERDTMVRRYRELRPTLPAGLDLPADIHPLLADSRLPAGLLSAWFSLCLAEFCSHWNP
jgi:hypothetical protein